MPRIIKKAIFPVAGIGSRFLPATKSSQKEMLPIVDKPLIQYAVEEAMSAGIKELIFVTSSTKPTIKDHFESNPELERKLAKEGKKELLDIVLKIRPKGMTCSYVLQSQTLGLGHAVLCAKSYINDEPFAILLADDLIDGQGKPCLKQMLEIYEKTQSSIIAIQKVPYQETDKYGIVQTKLTINGYSQIQAIIEKPKPEVAPSDMAVVGRYILTPHIFTCLENTQPGVGGEIQLTDGISELLKKEAIYACLFTGLRYDCGSKFGFLQATVAYALQHPEVKVQFKEYLLSVNAIAHNKLMVHGKCL